MRRPFSYATSRIHLVLFYLPSSMINVTVFPHFPPPFIPSLSVSRWTTSEKTATAALKSITSQSRIGSRVLCTCLIFAWTDIRMWVASNDLARYSTHSCTYSARNSYYLTWHIVLPSLLTIVLVQQHNVCFTRLLIIISRAHLPI